MKLDWITERQNETGIGIQFRHYFIILIGIQFGIQFSLELGTVFYYWIVGIGIGLNDRTPKRNWNWNRIAAIATRLSNCIAKCLSVSFTEARRSTLDCRTGPISSIRRWAKPWEALLEVTRPVPRSWSSCCARDRDRISFPTRCLRRSSLALKRFLYTL